MTQSKTPYFGQSGRVGYAPAGLPVFKFNIPLVPGPVPKRDAVEPASALPDSATACNTQGNEWLLAQRPQDALRAYDRAIALQPDYVDPHFNRGNALLRLQRNEEALASFEQAIALSPILVLAHYNRATVLQSLGRVPEAMEGYRTVLGMELDNVQARFNLGCLLLQIKQFEEALACMDHVVAQAPQVPEGHNNRGLALMHLCRDTEAVASFSQALALRPHYAEAYNNRGEAQLRLRQFDGAMADIRRAIELRPHLGESRFLLGKLLREMKRHEEALEQFGLAARSEANIPTLSWEIVQAKVHSCLWDSLSEDLARLQQELGNGRSAADPFVALSLFDDPALHHNAARMLVEGNLPAQDVLGPIAPRPPGGKIRIGYYSADFRNHPVAHLISELFEVHDRERFEWFAFYVGPEVQDTMHKRIASASDHFINVRERSDIEIATLSRELGIDIAVDLMGFTQESRLSCFAYRCAPLQVSYLGYPGTTGADYVDYVVVDKVVVPPAAQAHFAEKVVYMPHSYQVNDSQRQIAERVFSREELGLPSVGFVFCCFNHNYKIMPSTFDGWMRILHAVDGSVLWLLEDNPASAKNLRREAQARGIPAERLVFAPRMPMAEHLARQRVADLFLDTLPYNAHTTASDALWVGLPVLTCMGQSFASRVAASLLQAAGLPELVTSTQADFEARAIELARDPAQLGHLRAKLRDQGHSSALFDARLFARHIESAYTTMLERQQRGLPPDVIEVA